MGWRECLPSSNDLAASNWIARPYSVGVSANLNQQVACEILGVEVFPGQTKSTTMQSPPATTTAASGYTTIPISGADAISRSFQNLSTFFSRRRPWPEFLSTAGAFDCPESLIAASARSRLNSKYFGVNYAIMISTCAAASLLGSPFSLIVFALVFVLWLVLYFFREDPMVVWGHRVSDQVVILGLILVSVFAIWFTGIFNNLLIGISVGILISSVHGVFRNPEGLFLDENDALASGLIGSQSDSDSYRVHFSK